MRGHAGALLFVMSQMLSAGASAQAPAWSPVEDSLLTRWGAALDPRHVHDEHPRPRMLRPDWRSLNGLWEYAIRAAGDARPDAFDGRILVPFAVESPLSGVGRALQPDQRLWYRRRFEAPDIPAGGRLLLHFGAVDWACEAWVDGTPVGAHAGGYDAFTFDITDALRPDHHDHQIVVAVRDPTDGGPQPRGKQVLRPGGIWYTAVSGIWQTVWLEPVPSPSIEGVETDCGSEVVRVSVTLRGGRGDGEIEATAAANGRPVATARGPAGAALHLRVPQPRLWSPEDPFLYDLTVRLRHDGAVADEVQGYFGMRTIAAGLDERGQRRLLLNGRPIFQFGMLDQGWWPDGLYTAPSDEAMRFDVEAARRMGFNLLRKHVKIEPQRWYHHCDRLGVLVWQDMPSGDRYIGPGDADLVRDPESESIFRREYRAMIESLRGHPCVVAWVPFNEGWGQFDTAGVTAWTRTLDPTRPVNAASGWTDRGVGDLHDIHSYPAPAAPAASAERVAVLGEFGGLGWPVAGHLWRDRANWGYATYASAAELEDAYSGLIRQLRPLVAGGLAAAVYTQITDVEIEVNGLLTYDRARFKVDPERLKALHASLYEAPPRLRSIVETSEAAPRSWRFTTEAPEEGWPAPGFDDSGWRAGPGGFGTAITPGAVVGTVWQSSDIWLRRAVELEGDLEGEVWARLHHDEDAEIFVNGVLVARPRGYTTGYVLHPLDPRPPLRPGRNTIAIHCRQTAGGQFIDLGLVLATPP
jgi:hypothetical protein